MYRDLGKVRTNTCRQCGATWESAAKGRPAAYCSDACRTEFTKGSLPCSIEGCDKKASRRDPICPMHRARYREYGNYEGTAPRVCAHCGGEWIRPSRRGRRMKYCSNECFDAAMMEQDKARKEANKPKRTAHMRSVRYGLTQESFDAMYLAQGGRCAICGEHKDKDSTERAHRLYVDHNHSCCPGSEKTCGECVRALLCWHCNSGLGHFRDNPKRLAAAIEYVTKYRTESPSA